MISGTKKTISPEDAKKRWTNRMPSFFKENEGIAPVTDSMPIPTVSKIVLFRSKTM